MPVSLVTEGSTISEPWEHHWKSRFDIRKWSLSKQVLGNPGQELKTQKVSERRRCGTWKSQPREAAKTNRFSLANSSLARQKEEMQRAKGDIPSNWRVRVWERKKRLQVSRYVAFKLPGVQGMWCAWGKRQFSLSRRLSRNQNIYMLWSLSLDKASKPATHSFICFF